MAGKVKSWRVGHLIALIGILVAAALLGLRSEPENRGRAWVLTLALLGAFVTLAGHAATGLWRGVLIDDRNQISLARLQLVAWTLLVLSALLTAVLGNVALGLEEGYGWMDAIGVEIPTTLWILMGISVTSMVASPVVGRQKAERVAVGDAAGAASHQAEKDSIQAVRSGVDASALDQTLLLRKSRPEDAEWRDLLLGEEVGNGAHLDVAKVQMLLFSFVLWLGYGAALLGLFRYENGTYTALPDIPSGLITLLGVSHTAYLADKAVVHTRDTAPKGGAS